MVQIDQKLAEALKGFDKAIKEYAKENLIEAIHLLEWSTNAVKESTKKK